MILVKIHLCIYHSQFLAKLNIRAKFDTKHMLEFVNMIFYDFKMLILQYNAFDFVHCVYKGF